MQLFRSALVVSLSMFSVSANALSGVYKCPGHKYDVEAKYVEEYINRNVIDTEKADWAHFEENGVQYQNLILFVIDPLTDPKQVLIVVNKDKTMVKLRIHHGKDSWPCQYIPAEDTEKLSGKDVKRIVSRVVRK
ncbi:Bgt-51185 [Blumeria graminis f. sp. tritici]|uniref:Bgt-51185 n=1 Tax=Blumeria graminis f. sp. tritici TaxID=62690 RepID=A0A9X9QCT7_BLUGR|nr:Bgt-51185 [Blumeria graminis f. sp. tritici]